MKWCEQRREGGGLTEEPAAEQQIHLAEAEGSGKDWQGMSLRGSLGLAWKGLGMQRVAFGLDSVCAGQLLERSEQGCAEGCLFRETDLPVHLGW